MAYLLYLPNVESALDQIHTCWAKSDYSGADSYAMTFGYTASDFFRTFSRFVWIESEQFRWGFVEEFNKYRCWYTFMQEYGRHTQDDYCDFQDFFEVESDGLEHLYSSAQIVQTAGEFLDIAFFDSLEDYVEPDVDVRDSFDYISLTGFEWNCLARLTKLSDSSEDDS